MANKYTVRPFSGANYQRNAAKCRGAQLPCAICGKAITDEGKAFGAIVVDGGAAWGDENSNTADSGYMGGFLVGPDCHRRHGKGKA